MPTITKIVQQKKRKKRYSIFLDNVYAFGVEEDVLITYELKKGMALSPATIDKITNRDQFQRAYLLAINYLSYRMRAIEEIRVHLRKKEIDPEWVEEIVHKLIAERLLNDDDFADAYVRDRIMNTTKGPHVIKKELIEKGISASTATNAIQQYDEKRQFQTAITWLEKEQRKKTQHAFRKRNEQLRMKLYQKGFERDVIADVFATNQPELNMDREEEIFTKQADKLYHRHGKKLSGFDLHMKLKAALFQKGFQSNLIDAYISKIQDEENESRG